MDEISSRVDLTARFADDLDDAVVWSRSDVTGSGTVSVTADNPSHRYTYKEAFGRTRQLANALAAAGVTEGDRIATLAWNDYRHFELYYAISCSGAVCHTINPRLFPEQVEYIVNYSTLIVQADFSFHCN